MFRNNVMMITGSYVITEPIPDGKKVKAEIVRILQPDQIKTFSRDGIWPEFFSDCTYLDNSYKGRFDWVDKESLRTRNTIFSKSVTAAGNSSDQQIEKNEDEMPYIPHNPNIKGMRRHVISHDSSYEEESEEEVVPAIAVNRRRRGNR